MCLYNTKIYNNKYKPNIKNKGIIPECKDVRAKTIEIGCGFCYECRKKRANEWKIRLFEENKNTENEKAHFVTLTIDDNQIKRLELDVRIKRLKEKKFEKLIGYKLDNAIATLATRRFLERWRKENKKSVKHWFITELGQTNTERIHIHGIIWSDKIKASDKNRKSEYLDKKWQYGNTWVGKYVNEETITYVSKYITKTDKMHKHFKGKINTTPGIGKNYIKSEQAKRHKFNYENTKKEYINRTGIKSSLPTYYKKKIWNENEMEWLWMSELDKQTRWVWNEQIDISTPEGLTDYHNLLKYYRKINTEQGYGGKDTKRELLNEEIHKRELLRAERNRGYKRRKPLIYIPKIKTSEIKKMKQYHPKQVFNENIGIKTEAPNKTENNNIKYWGYKKPMMKEKKEEIIKKLKHSKYNEENIFINTINENGKILQKDCPQLMGNLQDAKNTTVDRYCITK